MAPPPPNKGGSSSAASSLKKKSGNSTAPVSPPTISGKDVKLLIAQRAYTAWADKDFAGADKLSGQLENGSHVLFLFKCRKTLTECLIKGSKSTDEDIKQLAGEAHGFRRAYRQCWIAHYPCL